MHEFPVVSPCGHALSLIFNARPFSCTLLVSKPMKPLNSSYSSNTVSTRNSSYRWFFDAFHDKPHRCDSIPTVGLYGNEIRPKIPFARMIVQPTGEINEFPIFHHVLLAFSMYSRRYGSSMLMG